MRTALLLLLCMVFITACTSNDNASNGQNPARIAFANQEAEALAQPFKGMTTSAGKEPGLFSLEAEGASTQALVEAAQAFIDGLTEEQKSQTLFAIDDLEWRKWLNVDNGIYTRQGTSLKAMTTAQKTTAFELMKASLSAQGLEQSRNIMKTEQTLQELTHNEIYDEELYFFTIMGEPSQTEPWGWQIDGHHLVINYFILGDQIVFSPVFMGAEPVTTTSGKYAGNRVFQEEQDLGLDLLQSLSPDQQTRAILNTQKGREDTQGAGFQDNLVLDYEGIQATELSVEQQKRLLAIIEEYVGNIRDEHAAVKMQEVKNYLQDTWFAWIGSTSDEGVFYYRIHSPVIFIEFDHQGPIAVQSKDGSRAPTRDHIHTMLRTPNGNDYGKDLLRQHLEQHHH